MPQRPPWRWLRAVALAAACPVIVTLVLAVPVDVIVIAAGFVVIVILVEAVSIIDSDARTDRLCRIIDAVRRQYGGEG